MSQAALTVTSTPIALTVTPSSGLPVSLSVTSAPVIALTISGATGPEGVKGDTGSTGAGVPVGGQAGYRLTKKTSGDYDTEWQAPTSNPAGNDKTIQYNDGGVLRGNDALRFDKNTNALLIGISGDTLPDNPISVLGAVDSYFQMNVRNTTEGAAASSDYVCTADNGTDDNHYIDMGINSSIYDVEEYNATKPNDGYIIVDGGDLVIGAGMTGNNVQFIAGGTTDADIVATLGADGFKLFGMNVPAALYGTGIAPSATGLPDGTLYFKYEV